MDKTTLEKAVNNCKQTTREALQIVYDSLNQGQQNKLLKDVKIKELFDLYEVIYNG